MKIEKTGCSYQVTECDLKFGKEITLDGELLIPTSVLNKPYKENGIYHTKDNERLYTHEDARAIINKNYTGKIKDCINGIEQDLANVTANEGHDLVKDSILGQAKRLANIATHNTEYRKEWFAKVRSEIEELARFHSTDVPMVYEDGKETVDKMVSLEELGRILAEIEDVIGGKL